MTRTYNVISADGHLEIPAEPWTRYVPEKHRDRAPRLLRLGNGVDAWLIEGQPLIHNGPNIAGGSPQLRGRQNSYWLPDGTPAPGTGGAKQRLKEQDADGIDAEVLFPPIFVSTAIQSIADKDVYRSVVRAYNTFLARDLCPVAPDRLIACGVIPVTGVDDAIAELRFCKESGLKAIALNEFPNGGKSPADGEDRFWEEALRLAMPLTAHVHMGTRYPPFITEGVATATQRNDRHMMAASVLTSRQVGFAPMYTVAQMMVSGVFDRLPELRIYFAETNASWMACSLWQMDDNYKTLAHAIGGGITLKKLPTEYFREHVYCSFIRDPNVGRMLDVLPVDNLMFGSDFPHGVTSFPDTGRWVDETFKSAPAGVRRKILVETPARYFGLKADQQITETPA